MIIKTDYPKNNPDIDIFTIEDFKKLIRGLRGFMETQDGIDTFELLMPMAYEHCLKSLWGAQWKFGMALLTAHYITLMSKEFGGEMGEAKTIGEVAGLGEPVGILTGQSVGEISLNYDMTKTMFDITQEPDAAFFNNTKYGIWYYSIWRTKSPIVIGVVI